MHHARALVVASGALAAAACMRTVYPEAEATSVVETTAAELPAERELSLDERAARFTAQICDREVRCHGDPGRAEGCWRTYLDRAHDELASWQCAPAAARARLKECISAVRETACTADLTMQGKLCGTNEACPDPAANIVSPGSALADAGL